MAVTNMTRAYARFLLETKLEDIPAEEIERFEEVEDVNDFVALMRD